MAFALGECDVVASNSKLWYVDAVATRFTSQSFVCELDQPTALDKVLKLRFAGSSWNEVRRLIETGKVVHNQDCVRDPRAMVAPGDTLELQMNAPRERTGAAQADDFVLHVDRDVVVVRKPTGLSSIVHEGETDSTEQLLTRWLTAREGRQSAPLGIVHRLDKVTSGVMVFARNQRAKLFLKEQFRAHGVGRHYFAVAHGQLSDRKIESRLVRNRGDGLRGSTRQANLGRYAATHVQLVEQLRGCCLVKCRLETGRTHQIRIHLAELGHPLVGEPVYTKGLKGPFIECERVLLHAARLSFEHPAHRGHLSFDDPLPTAFEEFVRGRRLPNVVPNAMPERTPPAERQTRSPNGPRPTQRGRGRVRD